MFNLGMSELILIAILALIFIGPKQLPEMAKALGRMMSEFKKASNDLTESFTKNALVDDLKKDLNPLKQEPMAAPKVEETKESVKTASKDDPNSV